MRVGARGKLFGSFPRSGGRARLPGCDAALNSQISPVGTHDADAESYRRLTPRVAAHALTTIACTNGPAPADEQAGTSPHVRAQFAAEQHHRPEPLLSEGAGVNPNRAVELITDALSANSVSDDG